MKILETTCSSITVRRKRWFDDSPQTHTVTVKWDPKSDSGRLKTAIVKAGLATFFDWGGGAFYNDAGQFRKSDKTFSRALKWKYSTIKRFTNAQKLKLEKHLRKHLMGVEEVLIYSPYDGTKGDMYVYLRVKACEC
jgi:hypothetical protein